MSSGLNYIVSNKGDGGQKLDSKFHNHIFFYPRNTIFTRNVRANSKTHESRVTVRRVGARAPEPTHTLAFSLIMVLFNGEERNALGTGKAQFKTVSRDDS